MRFTLNGWQRLWVVASTVYFLLVATLAVLVIPGGLPTEREVTRAWRGAALRIDWEATEWRDAPNQATSSRFWVKEAAVQPESDDPKVNDHDLINAIERKYASRPAVSSQLKALSEDYTAKLVSLDRARRWDAWRGAAVAFVVWLVPSLAIYALGLAVAWIVRGFR